MTQKDLIKSAEKIAFKTVKYELRKAIGKYYILWSTFPVLFYLIYSINPNLLNNFYSLFVSAIVYAFYLLETFLFFRNANRLYVKFSEIFLRRKSANEINSASFNRKIRVLFYALISVAYFAVIYSGFYISNLTLILFGISVGSFFVIISLYIPLKIVGIKYYDTIAFITFLINNAALSFGYYYVSYIFSLSWLYAGYKSLMEIIENE